MLVMVAAILRSCRSLIGDRKDNLIDEDVRT